MPARQQSQVFQHEIYQRTNNNIRNLKAKLPEDSVASLAKEVLTRIAARAPLSESWIERPSADQIDHLTFALLSDDETAGVTFIADARTIGASFEGVYLGYLAAAANRLGEWWNEGHVSITDVAIGSSRIFGIMRGMNQTTVPSMRSIEKSAIFAAVPDETHTLGVRMAADLFRRQGWDITLRIGLPHDDLVTAISQSDQRIIGLSAGGVHSCTALARLFLALRISAPDACIMISGQIVNEAPDLVAHLGPDAIVNDIPTAQTEMDRFWDAVSPLTCPI